MKTQFPETTLSATPTSVIVAPKLNWLKITFFSLGLALVISLVFMVLTLGIIGFAIWHKFAPELSKRNLSVQQLVTQIKAGWAETPILDQNQQNWVILGLDSLDTRGDVPPLTDTILLVGIQPQTANINLISLPRDLWFDDVQTKINALYAYGLEKDSSHPEKLITQTLGTNLNLPIHKTIVITLNQLETLIDIAGGVNIDVPTAFTDPVFPRTDVDIKTVHDPKLLYEVVTFTSGPQKMSGSLALKYIRSRHSGDTAGTDIARGERQQLVILSLMKQLTNLANYKKDPLQALNIWQWYEINFANQIAIPELISLFKPMIQAKLWQPKIGQHQLSVALIDKKTGKTLIPGVIFNPPVLPSKYLGQWVYIPTDINLLKTEIHQKLHQN